MHLIVLTNDDKQRAELLSKNKKENVIIDFVNNYFDLSAYKNADALLILQDKINITALQAITIKTIFIHSVILTLNDLRLPENISRINAWPTFLQRDVWEVATKNEATVKYISDSIGWKFLTVPDTPGLIAARIVAMIINEAYHAFEEGVSSKEEIDVAMRLGTNYPFGPFEWSQRIGVKNVYNLLLSLHKNNKRYTIAPALENEVRRQQ